MSPCPFTAITTLVIRVPSESVKNHRVVAVNGIWVVWWQANIAQLHLIARDPMVHHSKARIKGRPP